MDIFQYSILSLGLVLMSKIGSIYLILNHLDSLFFSPSYVNPAAANPASDNNHPATYLVLNKVMDKLNHKV